ncbi:MAG: hypothetical protein ACREN4_06255 [Candidatus Dormibacteria bacterium]
MALSLLPTGIALLDGGVDGLLRQNDLNNGRTKIHKQYSTWYEAVGFVGGLAAALLGAHPDIADPFVYGSGALLASKGGQWALQESQSSTSTTTTSTTGGGAAYGVMRGGGARAIAYGGRRNATAGVL